MTEWIKVDFDNLPEEGKNVLAYFNDGTMETFTFWICDESSWIHGFSKFKITHWMPLPDAPAVIERGNG